MTTTDAPQVIADPIEPLALRSDRQEIVSAQM
jgi:hypothetical protein